MAIASYFAKIGVDIDKASLKRVDDLLGRIEKQMNRLGTVMDGAGERARKNFDSTAKMAQKSHDYQMNLMQRYNKAQQYQQEKSAKIAQKSHDYQLRLMHKWEQAQKASQQRLASTVGSTTRYASAREIKLSQDRFRNSILGRTQHLAGGDEKSPELQRLAQMYERDAANATKAAENAAKAREKAEKEANRQIERDRKQHEKNLAQQAKKAEATRIREEKRRQAFLDSMSRRERIIQERGGRYGGLSGVEAFGRFGVMGLPFAGGVIAAGMGLSALNRNMQEVQGQELALQTVAGDKAPQYQEFINNLGNRLGMTTSTLMPGFTQWLAGAQGTALEPNLQSGFEAFTQYGAVTGMDPQSMKGSLRAITQMISKQQIMAEELRGQLSEHMPAAVRIMADAVTGGDTKALTELMAKGGLNPNEALPKFFDILRSRSEGMLPQYLGTTRFAQGSFNKAVEDMMKIFSKSGGESGFTNFFRTMTDGARSASPVVRGLAGAFDNLSRALEVPVSLFGDVSRGLEEISKQSGISEGALTTLAGLGVLMATRWGPVGAIFATVLIALQDISYGLKGYDSYTKRVMDWAKGKDGAGNPVTTPSSQRRTDPNDPLGQKGPLANFWQNTVRPAKDQFFNLMDKSSAIRDPNSPYFNDPKGYDDFLMQKKLAAQADAMDQSGRRNSVQIGDINVTINPQQLSPETDGQEIGETVKSIITGLFSQARSAFPSP